MPRKSPRPRPEDATSYADFLQRLGSERGAEIRREFSPATNLLWLIGIFSLAIGFIFLLHAVAEPPAPWWVWAVGLGSSALFLGLVASEIRHAVRAHVRHELLKRLARQWDERAASGEVPLSTARNLVQRVREELDMRTNLAVARDLQQAEASVPPVPRNRSTTYMYASLGALGAGVLSFFVLITASAFQAPTGVLVALLVAMPGFGVVGLILSRLANRAVQAQQARTMAVIGRLNSIRKRRQRT